MCVYSIIPNLNGIWVKICIGYGAWYSEFDTVDPVVGPWQSTQCLLEEFEALFEFL